MNALKYLPLLVVLVLAGCGKSEPDRANEADRATEPEHTQDADAAALLEEVRAQREVERQRFAERAERDREWRAQQPERDRERHLRRYGEVQIHNDGTVTIGTIGERTWMRCSIGQHWEPDPENPNDGTCSGDALILDPLEARRLVRKFNQAGGFAGHTDWRIPRMLELERLRLCSTGRTRRNVEIPLNFNVFRVCAGRYERPTIDSQVFPNAPSQDFLSSDTKRIEGLFGGTTYRYWSVSFRTGRIHLRYSGHQNYHLRLVRDED